MDNVTEIKPYVDIFMWSKSKRLEPYLPYYQIDIILKMEVKLLLQALDSLATRKQNNEVKDFLLTK